MCVVPYHKIGPGCNGVSRSDFGRIRRQYSDKTIKSPQIPDPLPEVGRGIGISYSWESCSLGVTPNGSLVMDNQLEEAPRQLHSQQWEEMHGHPHITHSLGYCNFGIFLAILAMVCILVVWIWG